MQFTEEQVHRLVEMILDSSKTQIFGDDNLFVGEFIVHRSYNKLDFWVGDSYYGFVRDKELYNKFCHVYNTLWNARQKIPATPPEITSFDQALAQLKSIL